MLKTPVMRRHHLPFLLLSVLFLSCTNTSDEDISAFRSLQETLEQSNGVISYYMSDTYHELQNKLADPSTNEKAKVLEPKAKKVLELTVSVTEYIEQLKKTLKLQAGIVDGSEAKIDALKNNNVVNQFFDGEKKGAELCKNLLKYRTDVLAVDSFLNREFNDNLLLTTAAFDKQSGKNFTAAFFQDISLAAALAALTKFQSNIYTIGNKTIAFLNNQVGYVDGFNFNSFSAIIAQNATVVLPGEFIEITSGIGGFTAAIKPVVEVDGLSIPIDAAATAIARFRAPSKPGNYSTLVKIKFIGYDGMEKTITKEVKYTVFNKSSVKQ